MDSRFDGKVALVTGGYGGIGAAVCRALAGLGAKVAIGGHNAEKAAGVCSGIRRLRYSIRLCVSVGDRADGR